MYVELLYSSVATKKLSGSELAQIVDVSVHNNSKSNVSGILVYHQREFLQLLEGPEEIVQELMEKISKDERHANIRVIWQHEIEVRGFENWSMGFVNIDDIDDSDELDLIDLTDKSIFNTYKLKGFSGASVSDFETTGKNLLKVLSKKL
jgi:hypothetical protein